jgi:chromosome segregation ATPase
MDEYVYPKISPERKRRLLKYLVLEHRILKKDRAHQRREDFVKKIDVLRSVAHIGEVKKAELAPSKSQKELEEKIKKVSEQENIIKELQAENKGIASQIGDIRGLIQKIESDHQQVTALQDSMKEIEKALKGDVTKSQLGQLNAKVMQMEQQLSKMQQEKEKLTMHEKIVEQKVLEEKPKVDIEALHKKRENILKKISDLKKKKR